MSDEKESRQEFNIDKIDSEISNVGGKMDFKDKVDFSQKSGDTYSGTFTGNVNIKSKLDNVTQSIGALPHGDPAEKQELQALVAQLQEQLSQLSEAHAADVKRVTNRLEALVSELEAEEPDEEEVQITGESLKRAAKNIAGVMPTVLQIATQIVKHAAMLAG